MPIEAVLFSVFALIAFGLVIFGFVCGYFVVPTIHEKVGIVCIVLPFLIPFACFYYYSQAKFVCRLFLAGMFFAALAGITYEWFRVQWA